MPRAGHRDRSTASIDHRHRKILPAFASNHLRSIRHNESERQRIGEVLRSIQVQVALAIGDDCATTSVTAVISHAIHAKGGAVVASAAGGPPEVILTVRYSRA